MGGLVGFVDGHVQWFEHFLWQKYGDEHQEVSDIHEAINPGAVIVDGQGSPTNDAESPSAPSEPPSEPEPEKPPGADKETPEESEPITNDEIDELIDSFADGEWTGGQAALLYAMNNSSGSALLSGVPSALANLFSGYFSGNITAYRAIQESFCPAYRMICNKFGDFIPGNADAIGTAVQNKNISEAKEILASYRSSMENTISALKGDDKAVYDQFHHYLTEVFHTASSEIYSDQAITSLNYDSPGAALAFASIAAGLAAYVLEHYADK
jgi:hypothetical protein